MTGENENGGGDLTPAEISNLRREHGDEAIDRELARRDRQAKDLNFEPPGSAPQRPNTGDVTPENAHAERMRLSKILADPSRSAVLEAGYRNRAEALDRLNELASMASGEAAPNERQIEADQMMQPESADQYKLDHPTGGEWTEESTQELEGIKNELFQHGANPVAVRAVFSDLPSFYEMHPDQHYSKVEDALNRFREINGDAAVKQVNAFVRSLKTENMRTAALVAGMSQTGLREMARLGRSLGRKAAH